MKKSHRNRKKVGKSLVDLFDEAMDCNTSIATIAKLMCVCERTQWLEAHTIARAGGLIFAETEKCRALLNEIKDEAFKE